MAGRSGSGGLFAYIRLARPKQWAKGAFVIIGPVYGLAVRDFPHIIAVLGAFLAFGFAASACYVVNDIIDREADQAHPRKKRRPIAAGTISLPAARWFALALALLAAASIFLVPIGPGPIWQSPRLLLAAIVGLYITNVVLYSTIFKHRVVLDVISLAGGFVLRVFGGCAAAAVEPSSWLLNVTFFVAMFLALGKRLGERRTLGAAAAAGRGVHAKYTDDLLRMAVVVTGVATLLTYADYVQAQSASYTQGFNLLWLTMLPATYGLLRAMVLLERGVYDDPTEMAVRDRPFQLSVVVFGLMTIALLAGFKAGFLAR